MKILTVVGARPQFVKAAPVSRALRGAGHTEYLVHTGQHYDDAMSKVFFDELHIPHPDLNLEIGSGSHGLQTGRMLIELDAVLQRENPDWMLVYGDTNSTLAGAVAACKLHIPICHVEAGLRSYNKTMPEEHNRVLTDHCSDLLLCPTQTAIDNLAVEGLACKARIVGDVMLDALNYAIGLSDPSSPLPQNLQVEEGRYVLATVHRAENTNNATRLKGILDAFSASELPIVFPVHPRTRKVLQAQGYVAPPHLHMIEPVAYLDMVRLQRSARFILTDSGGVQKEAYWLGVPCITLRDETEWVETVAAGWNRLVGTDTAQIAESLRSFAPPAERPAVYGEGNAAALCVEAIEKFGR